MFIMKLKFLLVSLLDIIHVTINMITPYKMSIFHSLTMMIRVPPVTGWTLVSPGSGPALLALLSVF